MKKLLFTLSALLLISCVGSFAQTYTYKYLYTVNTETGVKSNEYSSGRTIYVTFTNGKNMCYPSDRNGVKVKAYNPMQIYGTWEEGRDDYYYVSNSNGMVSYKQTLCTYHYDANFKKALLSEVVAYYNFSTDYDRLNTIWGQTTSVHVYERIDNKQPDTPTTLW